MTNAGTVLVRQRSPRSVIVTGAAGGIGMATVSRLLEDGASVTGIDANIRGLVDTPFGSHDNLLALEGDLRDEEFLDLAIDESVKAFGPPMGLFNNAAILGPVRALEDLQPEEFDEVFAVNVKSMWMITKRCLIHLRSQSGSIVNTASTAGLRGWPRLSAYVSSKHAVVGLTRAWAMELAGDGVRVNALCPGSTDTALLAKIGEANAPGDPAAATRQQTKNIPVGRLADPEEIAKSASWLLLDSPRYMTGSIVTVDGGMVSGFV